MRAKSATLLLSAFLVHASLFALPVAASDHAAATTGQALACVGYDETTTEDFCCWCGYYGRTKWELVVPWLLLVALALCSIVLTIERWLKYAFAVRQTRAFNREVTTALFFRRFEEIPSLTYRYARSPLAAVVQASLPGIAASLVRIRPSVQGRQQAIVVKTLEFRRGLWALAAIGWTAPMLGTLILVLSIMHTLYAAKAAEAASFYAIAGGIAESMWAPVFGLVAAFPTIWISKYFSAKVETLMLEMDRLSLAIIDQVVNHQQALFSREPSAHYITQELKSPATNGLTV